jgi:hypothetical protein
MELTGEHRIPAPRDVVWKALHDADILKDCIKGCEKFEFVSDDEIVARVKAKVGPVSATFDADVFIENEVPPESYTLRGEGKGGVAGFAKGSADVHLAEDGPDTILTYHAKATVGGKLAQLGSRLVDNTAKKYAADFFSTLTEKLTEGPGAEPQPAGDVVAAEALASAGAPAPTPSAASTGSAPAGSAMEPGPADVNAGKQVLGGAGTEPAHEGGGTTSTTLWILAALAVAVAAAALFAIL